MKLQKCVIAGSLLLITSVLWADPPGWISNLPYEKDAFMGVGSGLSFDEAHENARIDILMQLSSKVDSTVTLTGSMTADNVKVLEYCRAVVSSSSLRGAEIAETWQSRDACYVLLRYCGSCGTILVEAALTSAVEVVNRQIERIAEHSETTAAAPVTIDLDRIKEELNSPRNNDAVKLKRRLLGPAVPLLAPPEDVVEQDPADDRTGTPDISQPQTAQGTIDSDSYTTKNLQVIVAEDTVIIRLVNFPPDSGKMSEAQKSELRALSQSLFKELVQLGYTGATVVGHANPEGIDDEESELETLSRERAENLASFLTEAGITIDTIEWRGGEELIGSTETKEGRALNRRVDIYVHF